MRVAKPTANRYGVLRMEDVAGGRVIDDDGLSKISANLAQILDVIALMIVAAFSEQSVMYNVVDVQLVKERVAILRDGCRENNNFVQLTNSFQECVNAGSFDDIDIVILAFNFDRYRKVRLMENLCNLSESKNTIDCHVTLTLKLLCTNVSSRSSTKHFRPCRSCFIGGNSHFCDGSGVDTSDVSWLTAVLSWCCSCRP